MNWGYWGNLGIVASPAYQQRMAQLGLGSIETQEGMQALDVLLAAPVDQLVYLRARGDDMLRPLLADEEVQVRAGGVSLAERIQARLRRAAGPASSDRKTEPSL